MSKRIVRFCVECDAPAAELQGTALRKCDNCAETKECSRCAERKPITEFYFVSKKTGTRRGQCKDCLREVKRAQREPDWVPTCSACDAPRERVGPGRRLCRRCFEKKYDADTKRKNGAHRLLLSPCRNCGVERVREDAEPNTSLCAVCRSVPQHRRKKLKQLYSMTPAEENALLDYQGHRCAICRNKPGKLRLAIDHQHRDPSLIRGAICNPCNTMLGLARDRIDVLRAAIKYLENPPAQEVFPGKVATDEANRNEGWTENPFAFKRSRKGS